MPPGGSRFPRLRRIHRCRPSLLPWSLRSDSPVTHPIKEWQCGSCKSTHTHPSPAHSCCQPEVKNVWICVACGEQHEHKENAVSCCKPEVDPVWICSNCQEEHDSSESADECCDEKERCPNCMRDHAQSSIQAAQVTIAGHCDHCNPHYPIEQHHEIEDAFERLQEQE